MMLDLFVIRFINFDTLRLGDTRNFRQSDCTNKLRNSSTLRRFRLVYKHIRRKPGQKRDCRKIECEFHKRGSPLLGCQFVRGQLLHEDVYLGRLASGEKVRTKERGWNKFDAVELVLINSNLDSRDAGHVAGEKWCHRQLRMADSPWFYNNGAQLAECVGDRRSLNTRAELHNSHGNDCPFPWK
jgi:hypothetical protein